MLASLPSAVVLTPARPVNLRALQARYAYLVDRPLPEHDEPAPTKPTPAMLAHAAAGDLRETLPAYHDAEEAAECGIHQLCAAELALAQD